MKQHSYPEWVYQYRTKGTSIKKVGENYYLYRTSSKRVPEKSYPVVKSEYIGVITENGVIMSEKKKLNTNTPKVYEYGFSYVLNELAYERFRSEYAYKEDSRYAFLQILKKHSVNSWFLQEAAEPRDLHLNVSLQEKKIEKIIGRKISELNVLKYIYAIVMDQRVIISEISPEAQALLEELEVELHEPQ